MPSLARRVLSSASSFKDEEYHWQTWHCNQSGLLSLVFKVLSLESEQPTATKSVLFVPALRPIITRMVMAITGCSDDRVGVLFVGEPGPGSHNVVVGLVDALASSGSVVLGFPGESEGGDGYLVLAALLSQAQSFSHVQRCQLVFYSGSFSWTARSVR